MKVQVVHLVWSGVLLFSLLSNALPDRQCLDCMCQASSGCKPNIRCHNTGDGQYFCGPYQVSWAYWADAGKPGYNGFSNDFENCLIDKNCAEATIRGYMAKWGTDCNGDGRVDCLDYAAIHKAGPGSCNPGWLLQSKYWTEMNQCLSKSPSLGSSAPRQLKPSLETIIEVPKPIKPQVQPARVNSYAISSSLPRANPIPSVSFAPTGTMIYHSSYSARSNFSRTQTMRERVTTTTSNGGVPSIVQPSIISRPVPIENSFTRPSVSYQPLPGATSYRPAAAPVNRVTVTETEITEEEPAEEPPTRVHSVPVTSYRPAAHQPIEVPVSVNVPVPVNVKPSRVFESIVPIDCLECLCQASSGCDLNKGCDGAYCGPFTLSWGYWADGGQPGNDYATCAKSRNCSEQAVQGYMNKWQRDCNGDNRIDCVDYALIHKLGPHGCGRVQALEATEYWTKFSTCQSGSPSELVEENYEEVPRETTERRSIPSSTEYRVNSILPKPLLVSSNPSRPESSIRISFNNREVVNTNPSAEEVEPEEPVAESIQPNINTNLISNSPFPVVRPLISNPRVPASVVRQPSLNPIRPANNIARPVPTNYGNANYVVNSRPTLEQPEDEVEEPQELPKPQPRPIAVPTTNNTDSSSVPKECLECICHASSRCSASIGCLNDGRGKFICGPYQVDWEYWTEAGKPGNRADLSNLENFQMCLNNRECADQTVRAYIDKYSKDCNEDGVVDCNDYAALHVAGPKACNARWYTDSKYYSDFRECFDFRRR